MERTGSRPQHRILFYPRILRKRLRDLLGEDLPARWSVVYVSLENAVEKEAWLEQYRQMGADAIDLADYVKDTYGQTLTQLGSRRRRKIAAPPRRGSPRTDFRRQARQMLGIMGPSGSGKSTLLYLAAGMDQPSGGKVWLGETEITGLKEDEKSRLRLHRMGFVFQQMNMMVGSSANRISGAFIMLLQIQARCSCPPETCVILRSSSPAMESFRISVLALRQLAGKGLL